MSTYRVLKNKLPGTLQSMSLYLANKDTEFILFKPVRVSITHNIRLCWVPNIVYESVFMKPSDEIRSGFKLCSQSSWTEHILGFIKMKRLR